jgi:hypothetical protein
MHGFFGSSDLPINARQGKTGLKNAINAYCCPCVNVKGRLSTQDCPADPMSFPRTWIQPQMIGSRSGAAQISSIAPNVKVVSAVFVW